MHIDSDRNACEALGHTLTTNEYITKAITILKEKDEALVRVHTKLMEEREHPSCGLFIDAEDGVKRQIHLTREEFESLL